MAERSVQCFLGIDGGASKTRGVIVDSDGCRRAYVVLRGSAIVGEPTPDALTTLAAVCDALYHEAGCDREDIAGHAIGLSGIDFEDELPMQRAIISRALGLDPTRFTLVNDGVAALWGATPAPACAMFQFGSALTTVCRRTYGAEQHFDTLDVGGVFDLRNELIKAIARMVDGRIPATPLLPRVLAFLEQPDGDHFVANVYYRRIPRERLMATVPLLVDAWQEGDPVARRLMQQAMEDYVLTVAAMLRRVGVPTAHAAFGGGVIQRLPDAIIATMADAIQTEFPQATVGRALLSAECGAAVLAAYHAGMCPATLFQRCLHSSAALPPSQGEAC